MCDFDDVAAMLCLLVREQGAGRIDRRRRQPSGLELFEECRRLVIYRARFDQPVDQRPQVQSFWALFSSCGSISSGGLPSHSTKRRQ